MVKLQSIYDELKEIRREIKTILYMIREYFERPKLQSNPQSEPMEVLLSLDDHERITYLALVQLKEPSDATTVSSLTGRSRAVESMHLNQLVKRNVLKKTHNGRKILFQTQRNSEESKN